jgi:hypothetical protein
MKYPKGIAKYRIDGQIVLAQYMGRQRGFECSVCGKGCNAFTFNIFHQDNGNYANDVNNINQSNYETWEYGPNHIEDAVELIEEYHLIHDGEGTKYLPKLQIDVSHEQIDPIRNITASTRYEAMEQVAAILGKHTGTRGTWSSTRKTIIIDNVTTAEITFSKGKVKDLQYYDHTDNYVMYTTLYF